MKFSLALTLLVSACSTRAAQPVVPAFFENAGARLAFSLDLPAGNGPFPAVVLGHGSGRITDSTIRCRRKSGTILVPG